jgi:hypothetical protein
VTCAGPGGGGGYRVAAFRAGLRCGWQVVVFVPAPKAAGAGVQQAAGGWPASGTARGDITSAGQPLLRMGFLSCSGPLLRYRWILLHRSRLWTYTMILPPGARPPG